MPYYLLLATELLTLFLTSKYLIQALYGIFYRIFRKHGAAATCVFIIFFPGVIIHELSHLISAEALMVRTGELEVAPRVEGNSLRMGSVMVAKTDIFRSMLIGVAPIIVGTAVMLSILFFYLRFVPFGSNFSGINTGFTLVVLWAIFLIVNTMFSSKKDLEGVVELGLASFFIGFIISIMLLVLKVDFFPVILGFFGNSWLVEAVKTISLLLLVPVGINTSMLVLARLMLRRIY